MQAPDDGPTEPSRAAGQRAARRDEGRLEGAAGRGQAAVAKKAAANKAVSKKAVANKAVAKKAVANKAVAKKAVAKKAARTRAPAAKVGPEAPAAGRAPATKPASERAAPATARAGKPAAERAAPVKRAAATEARPEVAAPARAAPAGKKQPSGPPVVRDLRRAVVVLLVLGLCGFLIDGAARPANPSLVPAADPTAARGAPAFGAVTLSVAPGKHAPVCVLEAVTAAQQNYGLMNRTSVAPYAGMAFVFAGPSEELFYMKNTLIPLSIAWFDDTGRFEAATVMPPCPKTAASCPTYGPGRPYTLAVEVPAGRLGAYGIGPGSTVHLGGACA